MPGARRSARRARRKRRGLGLGPGQQQLHRPVRPAHAPGGVEPRREQERGRFPAHRAVALAGAIEQRAKARDAIKLPQPEGDDGAVAPAKRHHVPPPWPRAASGQTLLIRPFRVERARELEGDARAAQARLGRGQAGPRLRHDRAGVRQLCAGQVMVGDDQVHAERAARARLLERIDAGIHRHNKAHAFAGDVAQGRLVQAVSLAVARGQVIDRVRTGRRAGSR